MHGVLRQAGIATLAAAVMLPAAASAQIKASEHATLSQTVDGTVMTMEYHRPSLRGRDSIFGGQVHYGDVWTPGANWATTFETTRDVHMDGVLVPEGRYSVWMVVGPDDWEMVFEPEDSLFHLNPPELSDEQIRFMVTPQEVDFSLETLAWYFDDVKWNGADLRMHWGQTMVEFSVDVEPSFRMAVTTEEAAPYPGTYQMISHPAPEWDIPPDTSVLVITLTDEHLVGRADEMTGMPEGQVFEVMLLPRGEGFFIPGLVQDGELWEVFEEWVFEFLVDEEGRATSFELRMEGDALFQTGTRIPANE